MDFPKRAAARMVVVVAVAMMRVSEAAVYKVGDGVGWTSIGNLDYKQWAATKTFQVGDIIHFEYNAQFHNVMRVTHPMYKACNASAPLATYTTGNDTVNITTKGHHYFICGVPGHCQSDRRLTSTCYVNPKQLRFPRERPLLRLRLRFLRPEDPCLRRAVPSL
ncbi:Detected protein of confused Function [Hibiscus syriacus]|uniref:Detected protein of confused Function n=1 Tax=Hibiscus syriacus TaxID=106335 RepID=A0A6A3BRU5_HIBSY|nr:Detected protein of confused Function [Hibiscus syriacus]